MAKIHQKIPVTYVHVRRDSVQMYCVLAEHNKPTNTQNMQRTDPEHEVRKHLIQEKHSTSQS